jgi:hypothetical protein
VSETYIPKALRERVATQARFRCGYCLTSEAVVGTPMEIDHIIPEAHGGRTVEENLWLACTPCNQRKSDRLAAWDPLTEAVTPLYDPRRQRWEEHFSWSPDGLYIVGLTSVGCATRLALDLNRPVLVRARRLWVAAGWHPPAD